MSPFPLHASIWMTHNLFKECLLNIEKKMKLQTWKILLLKDNCAAHKAIPQMDHVRAKFPHQTAHQLCSL